MVNAKQFLDNLKAQVEAWVWADAPELAYVYGTVVSVSNTRVKIIRAGELIADNTYYPTLGPWTPEVGQRVFATNISGGLIVLGPINKLLDPVSTTPITPVSRQHPYKFLSGSSSITLGLGEYEGYSTVTFSESFDYPPTILLGRYLGTEQPTINVEYSSGNFIDELTSTLAIVTSTFKDRFIWKIVSDKRTTQNAPFVYNTIWFAAAEVAQ